MFLRKSISSIVILLFFFSSNIIAQQDNVNNINIHQSETIAKLLSKHKEINKNFPLVEGFRIQIFSVSGTNSRDRADLFKAETLIKYPEAEIYIVYNSPSYKVRLGNFRNKLEALNYFQTINTDFPFGFIVIDKIEFK
ncbi:MAG: hypothetical protein AUJ98_09620 [Bacteroidetes bacterium CG2_30_33_31]|nr:MAG: hypothetical protein AUJ98_09620 [Bacteroidetes bacterium CG2_30_33_31]